MHALRLTFLQWEEGLITLKMADVIPVEG